MRRRDPFKRVRIIFWGRAERNTEIETSNNEKVRDGTAIVEKVNQAVRHSHVHRTMDKEMRGHTREPRVSQV